jgi:hypothetical protein
MSSALRFGSLLAALLATATFAFAQDLTGNCMAGPTWALFLSVFSMQKM